ncbi:MAG: Alpha,alpha-trehalose phosphorylase [Lentisphaerae bacterium ADurb.BinA184]|nr:MAG: Alpha,alpha-trehalose phosphorylase [Lentisphaerae bacterium ADurb.BinA184]
MSSTLPPRWPVHPWRLIEPEFRRDDYRLIEGLFALSNGYLGVRASFEEGASGVPSLRGHYAAGVFSGRPNSTMIRLKGRPAMPREMVNLPEFSAVCITLDGVPLDLGVCEVRNYARTLHMDEGFLERRFSVSTPAGGAVECVFTRLLSMRRRHVAASRFAFHARDRAARLSLAFRIDGDVCNDNGFRHIVDVEAAGGEGGVHSLACRTAESGIRLSLVSQVNATVDGRAVAIQSSAAACTASAVCEVRIPAGATLIVDRIVAVASSRDVDAPEDLAGFCGAVCLEALAAGWEELLAEQRRAWRGIWSGIAVEIEEADGSGALTQGLHYSIFQMRQNAPNADPSVNIGAKGLTGEHYCGTYFWDTEAFMLPMFGFVAPEVARDLVRFRVRNLPGARRKAAELGLGGAAYPFMSDADGDEACTLWQFGLMGVHVTAAVAWGVWFTWCVTGDLDLIADGGIDVMVETCRFWCSRVQWRADLGQYVINAVLGPDEYHQGVHNSFYTNIMAQENLLKALRLGDLLRERRPGAWREARARLSLSDDELARFREVAARLRLPRDEARGLDVEFDGFEALEPYDLKACPPGGALPAVWSYDRAMRTRLLRQGDVIVANLLLGDRFDREQVRRDFEYYEPMTTHDSSLSFCHHAILAAQLGKAEMAYDYFLRTARLDLDDLHGNSWMGVHTACLAGAWQCVVLGFGGVRWFDGRLSLDPRLPEQWKSFSFSLFWHGVRVLVNVAGGEVCVQTDGGEVAATVAGRAVTLGPVPVRVAMAG